MNKIINNSYFRSFVIYALSLFFLGSFLFARSFIGITVFGYRIGEIFIGLSLLGLLFSPIFLKKEIKHNLKDVYLIISFILLGFFFIAFESNSLLTEPYTYRASSYIWTLGFLFLGIWLKKDFIINVNKLFLIEFLLIVVYVVSILDYPNFIQEFFNTTSDKYELHKGSDLLLIFVCINYIIMEYFKRNEKSSKLFLFNISLFMPLFLYKSRAAFIAALIYIFIELFSKKFYFKKTFSNLIFLGFLFLTLTFSTFYSQRYVVEEFSPEIVSNIPNAYKQLGEYKFSKYQEEYPILYFSNQRLYSGDGNLNWRLQLWQDSIEDLNQDSSQLFGNGYKDKFRVFIEENLICPNGKKKCGNDRVGLDGLNQNIHNYLLTIYLRGGFYHLSSFVILNLFFLFHAYKNAQVLNFLKFYIPVMFVSFFDSSMENAHFPLVVYFFIGFYFIKNKD